MPLLPSLLAILLGGCGARGLTSGVALADSCGSIGNSDLRYFCHGNYRSVGDNDLRYYGQASCGSISNADLRYYCQGNYGSIGNSDMRYYGQASCGSIGSADLRYLCRAGRKYPGPFQAPSTALSEL